MELEFLDPGPDQPYGARVTEAIPAPRPGPLDRETFGLLVMLAAAAVLPVVAAFQQVYAVREGGSDGALTYAIDAWGRYAVGGGASGGLDAHGPRFGVVLAVCGGGFAVLALALLARVLVRRAPLPRAIGAGAAGAAGALAGLLTGVTAAMALQIESVFDNLRTSGGGFSEPVREVRLRVGGAVWLSLAGLLAGGLAIAAALRLRRRRTPPGVSIPPPER